MKMWSTHCFLFNFDEMFLKSLFYFYKIFGVAPMTLDSTKNRPSDVSFAYSKFGILYNLFLVILTIFAFYQCAILVHFDVSVGMDFQRFVNTTHLIFFVFTTLIVLIIFCVRQERAVALANRLSSIYYLNKNIKLSAILPSIKGIVSMTFITTIMWLVTTPYDDAHLLTYYVAISLYNFVINSVFLQYSVLLKLLYHLYRSLNTDLRSLLESLDIAIEMDRHSNNEIKLTSGRLKRLREIHMLLCHLSGDVADFYSLPIFFCITNAFFVLIIYSYYVFRGFAIAIMPVLVTVHCTTMMVVIVVSLTILLRTASVTAAESRVSGEIVSESMASCSNQFIGRQLEVLSIYFLHKNVKFCVFNLYSLDESLLMSIVGVITTYLMILLQLDGSSNCK
ncbi:gustatory receptor 23 [Nasonia vitripennis]|uniref:Gustatory receptor n=1 Tax=Nasonia vitripennis TaxID=7425 RepID=A0A7M6UMV1_NASVI|nr:gustatory receptor 23 [Nasonia vitripennis]